MKIFITGISGFWGSYLFENLRKAGHEVFGTYKTFTINDPNAYKLDIVDKSLLIELLDNTDPDVIIHTAAMSKVDTCRDLKEEACRINVEASKNIAEWCETYSSRMIFFSTDLVYNSDDGDRLFKETDDINPSCYYAETKSMAEMGISKTMEDYIILRVALSYGKGHDGHNSFSDWLYSNLSGNKTIDLFLDQWRTPVYVYDGLNFINALIEKNIKNELFNFGGMEKVNRVQFGELFCDVMDFSRSLINEVHIRDINGLVFSSHNSSMNTEKIREATGLAPGTIKANFEQMK